MESVRVAFSVPFQLITLLLNLNSKSVAPSPISDCDELTVMIEFVDSLLFNFIDVVSWRLRWLDTGSQSRCALALTSVTIKDLDFVIK